MTGTSKEKVTGHAGTTLWNHTSHQKTLSCKRKGKHDPEILPGNLPAGYSHKCFACIFSAKEAESSFHHLLTTRLWLQGLLRLRTACNGLGWFCIGCVGFHMVFGCPLCASCCQSVLQSILLTSTFATGIRGKRLGLRQDCHKKYTQSNPYNITEKSFGKNLSSSKRQLEEFSFRIPGKRTFLQHHPAHSQTNICANNRVLKLWNRLETWIYHWPSQNNRVQVVNVLFHNRMANLVPLAGHLD